MKHVKLFSIVLVSLLTTCLCIYPFSSSVKALSQTPGTTTAYGYYSCKAYKTSDDSIGELTIGWPDQGIGFNMPLGPTSSVFEFSYVFNDYYSGSITITIGTDVSYNLQDCSFTCSGGWFHKGTNADSSTNGIPSLTTNSNSKKFIIDFYNTNSLSFMIVHENRFVYNSNTTFTISMTTSSATTLEEYADDIATDVHAIKALVNNNFDYKLSDMAGTLSDILTELQSFNDYMLYMPTLTAYVFTTWSFDGQVLYNNGSVYPYITVTNGYLTRTTFYKPNSTNYYYFYSSSNNTVLEPYSNNVNVSVQAVYPYVFNNLRLIKATITNPSNSIVSDTLVFRMNSNIIPVYYGDGRNMPLEIVNITGHDSENLTTERLATIIDLLEDFGYSIELDPTNANDYNNGLNSVGDFIQTVKNTLPSTDFMQNDINTLPDFGTEFNSISQFVQSFYVDLTTAVPKFKWLIIIGLLVVVLRVIV